MQTGHVLEKNILAMDKAVNGFSGPLVFECRTDLQSYGLSNGGIVEWEEFHQRAGLIENAKEDGSFSPSFITASGVDPCHKAGDWEILGRGIKKFLASGDIFPEEYKDYIWTLW